MHNVPVDVREQAGADPVDAISARLPATDRRGWLLLTAVALLVVAGLLWAVLGRAPETVTGGGMIVPTRGFVDVGTFVSGSVTQVLVSPGEVVVEGQPVAVITEEDGSVDEIVTRVAGTVATIVASQGGITRPGLPLMTIDPADNANVAVGFLPAAEAGQIRVGMPALVAVSSFPQSQHGYITGTVRTIALLPATFDRIRLLVGGNDQLPEFFTADGPVVEVTISLDEDANNPTGYAWTSGRGPNATVTTGELASVAVVLSNNSPLERILG